MLKLQSLYDALIARGKTAYRVVSTENEKWDLSGVREAKAVKFSMNLIVYYDDVRGYGIYNVDQFSNGQLVMERFVA